MSVEIEEEVLTDKDIETVEDLINTRNLILHNDDHNTFDYVIVALIDICQHTWQQAEQCAMLVHFNGKCQIKHGTYEYLKPMKEELSERGLSVTIE